MKLGYRGLRPLLALLFCTVGSMSRAQVNVTTYHNDISRSGANTQETILTPANVNSTQFGKLFSVAVDGNVYAQPLYLSGVAIGGGQHNVVYVATEHDSLYAIDANNGAIYFQISLIPAGGSTVNGLTDLQCTDLLPEVGITGTPVIDPASNTIYLVAKSKVNGNIVQYLHAIDVATSAEKFGGPVLIKASVAATTADGNGTTVQFDPKLHNQRAALLLENGHVVIAWGAHCDIIPWHGWLMSYNASTLAQEAIYNTTTTPAGSDPNGCGGIWMAGSGPAADSSGNLYFASGNGAWNGTTDLSDSIVKLGPPGGGTFPVLDYFTPFDQSTLQSEDADLGSGGLMLLPSPTPGVPYLAQQSKEGTMYLLNTGNLGKYCINQVPACSNSDPQITEEIQGASSGIWGSPAYWNGNLYWTGANDPIQAYSFNPNSSVPIAKNPTSQSALVFAFAAPTPSISASGNTNGILWALDGSADDSSCDGGGANCLGLYAYDATNLGNLLYKSTQAANNRDSPGTAVKFATPIIANGKVYVGTQGAISAYGLLNVSPAAAAPVLNPVPGGFAAAQAVTLTDATPGSTIYYTTDGTTPTGASAVYATPLQVGATTTINAIAAAGGYNNSAVTTGTYTIGAPSGPAAVNLAGAYNLAGFYADGTLFGGGGFDGDGYAYSAALIGASVTWNGAPFTFGAAGGANAVSSATVALPAGNVSTLSLLAAAVNGNMPNQTFVVTYTDGTTTTFVQSLSDWFTPQNYAGETVVLSMPYRISQTGTADHRPFFVYGYSFAVNGAKIIKSITLPANRNVVVLAIDASGGGPATPAAASPTMSPASGGFTAAQSVTLADTTPGATIFYTTNGGVPTRASTPYAAPIPVGVTTTINAIAVAGSYLNSAVSTATYTISAPTPVATSTFGINLANAATVVGIATDGAVAAGGGLDGVGNSFSATLLGPAMTWAGSTFTFGAAGAADAVSNAVINLPAWHDTAINLLAVGVFGNQTDQTFVVTYTDGTTSTFTQSISDWFTPQNYAGETQVLSMPYRNTPNGTPDNRPFYLYGYSFAVNSAKIVASITLPASREVVVLAIDVSTAAAAAPTPGTAPGTYATAQTVALTDGTAGAAIYYSLDGSTPTTASTPYSAPISIGATTTINAIAVAGGYANSAVASGTYTIGTQGQAAANTPTLIPTSGTFTSAQSVMMLDATPGAVVHYTLDGSPPTAVSPAYAAPIQVGATTTINAMAVATGYLNSPGVAGTYTITLATTAATPSMTPAAGGYTGTQSVVLADTTPGATIYYTTDGSTPTTASKVYAAPLTVAVTTTINAVAVANGYLNSAVGGGTITVAAQTGGNGNVNVSLAAVANVVGFAADGAAFTGGGLDGGGASFSAALLGTSITWAGSTFTWGAAGVADSVSNAVINLPPGNDTAINVLATGVFGNQLNQTFLVTYTDGTTSTFTQNVSDWHTPQNYAGESQVLSMPYRDDQDGTQDNHGPFVLYGYSFAVNSAKIVESITPPASRNVVVLAVDATSGTAAVPAATAPTLSPAAGSFTTEQNVVLADVTPGAVIYYTLDGTTPTATSTPYVGPLQIGATTTINAMAASNGYLNSTVTTGTYTIALQTATPAAMPTFGPVPGAFTAAQAVTLADTTPNAVIYYTTNGTTPTAASTPYTAPIQVGVTTTFNAIAVAPGSPTSALATGTYTITGASTINGPVFVSLAPADNVIGFVANGAAFAGGGFDGDGNAYSAALLGTSITWAGSTFPIGAAGAANAVSNATIALPAGSFGAINFLGAAVNGNQQNQAFVVTYTDGTTTTFTQSLSDWHASQAYAGETLVLGTAYRNVANGTADLAGPFNIYGYSFAVNPAKTLKSITLPANHNVIVLAVDAK